ncbi:MAG TPA: hypothetical protein VMY05_09435 [Acidobacteriota bacterium]|nr:hypothetical protein [Acidobacteriota bacterium]
MHKGKPILLLVALALVAVGSEALAISRVARRLSMLQIHGGYALPFGTYDQLGTLTITDQNNRPIELDADDVFDPSFSLGVSYGQLRNNHMLVSMGFRYIRIDPDDALDFGGYDYDFGQYDLDFHLDYMFLNLYTQRWSPYFGLGINAGLTVTNPKGFDSESEAAIALSLNFGADVKLWSDSKGRSMVTLASVNSWNAVASGDRPRYLQIGAGIRYWFRP